MFISHGEAYLAILQTQLQEKGIYVLDEPEAALSPLKQLYRETEHYQITRGFLENPDSYLRHLG